MFDDEIPASTDDAPGGQEKSDVTEAITGAATPISSDAAPSSETPKAVIPQAASSPVAAVGALAALGLAP
eukprot:2393575-Pyramimonas_sp.AAC.1